MQVLKIGGHQVDDPDFLKGLAALLKNDPRPRLIVHGGGKEISALQAAFGLEAKYIDGLRVSDEQTLALTQMALCGAVNTRLVSLFALAGLEAQGLSGLDRGLIRAHKMLHPGGDLGRVGEVSQVRADILQGLLDAGVLPVIAPICLGDDGPLNVNADHVAGAVGAAMAAEGVVFLTNVPGVLHEGAPIPRLTPSLAADYIAGGVISGGMIPKVQTALDLVAKGAAQVLITDLAGLAAGQGTFIRG
jgi:acetylglutamate kinase